MSRDFSSKGGRAGGKQRKFDKKHHSSASSSSGAEGADGVDAWSADSIADFKADQAMLAQHLQTLQTPTSSHESAPSSASSAASTLTPVAASSPSSAAPSNTLLPVDGSLLEGGGQVLRNAIAYSSLLAKPIHITKIRAGRMSGGGLKAQHLKGIELVHDMLGGKVDGAGISSREIQFQPGEGNFAQLKNPTREFADPSKPTLCYNCDIATAGATGLLIQTALPVALFMPHPVEMTLRGGTNASMAPIIDYSIQVFGPLMAKWFGLDVKFELVQRGFFPKGGGVVKVHTQPIQSLKAINVTERGKITKITGLSLVTYRLPVHIADRMAEHARKVLHKEHNMREIPIEIQSVLVPEAEAPMGDGVSLILCAHTSTGCIFGSSSLGERGKPAEDVASKAVDQLVANLDTGGCMDEYQQDQVIIWMALAEGTSTIKTGPLTLHTRTCLYWAQYFTGCKVNVLPAKGNSSNLHPEVTDCSQTFLIEITGCGYKSRFHK